VSGPTRPSTTPSRARARDSRRAAWHARRSMRPDIPGGKSHRIRTCRAACRTAGSWGSGQSSSHGSSIGGVVVRRAHPQRLPTALHQFWIQDFPRARLAEVSLCMCVAQLRVPTGRARSRASSIARFRRAPGRRGRAEPRNADRAVGKARTSALRRLGGGPAARGGHARAPRGARAGLTRSGHGHTAGGRGREPELPALVPGPRSAARLSGHDNWATD
jgi:hypothetical protein